MQHVMRSLRTLSPPFAFVTGAIATGVALAWAVHAALAPPRWDPPPSPCGARSCLERVLAAMPPAPRE